MGCIILFIVVSVVFALYSIPKLKQQETYKQDSISTATLERVWGIVDSVHRAELMEDEVYVELLEEYEDLKTRMENISGYVSDAESAIYELERKGIDVSEIEDAINNISSECE